MTTVNYAQVRDALYNRESFQHGSCNALRADHSDRTIHGQRGIYRVWSYNTLILSYSLDEHCVTFFDNRRYSNTTSRLQNMIRDQFGLGGPEYDARVVFDKGGIPCN